MNLLIVTNTCSAKKNNELDKKRKKIVIDPQQKFFRLFIEGISQQEKVDTVVLSALPVSASTVDQKKFSYEEEQIGKVCYHYIPFKNGKISRYFSLIISTYREMKKWCKIQKNLEAVVIVDPLVPMISIPARVIAQKKCIKVGAIVTDLPLLCTSMKGRKESFFKSKLIHLYQTIADKDIDKYDFYIPLTESLNDVVNKERKPYCIIEGFADNKDVFVEQEHDNYIMYAGGVYEKYGIKTLVEAFIELARNDIELWIFGDGPYVDEIKKINKRYSNIIYKGCVTQEEVVRLEKKAMLLINPRPINEEFAKYSFPSKIMEYLLSGTPVASTKLLGIPEEYFKYLYSLESGEKQEICSRLEFIIGQKRETLLEKGKLGHDFVIKEKSNIKQGKKIIMLVNEIIKQEASE